MVLLCLTAGLSAQPPEEMPGQDEALEAVPVVSAAEEAPLRWFVLFGIVSTFPGLERERLLPEVVDPLFRTIAPGYPGTNTFTDFRDKGLILPPQIAIGRTFGDNWALSVHGGYSAGKVRTKATEPSIFLGAPFHSDIEIKRSAFYIGLDLDYYPLGAAELAHYDSLAARLRAAKPALGTRLNWTLAGYDAQVKIGLKPLLRVPTIKISEQWRIPSVNLCAGVDVPWDERNVLVWNAGYNWFKEERGDFNGWAFTLAWRHFFR